MNTCSLFIIIVVFHYPFHQDHSSTNNSQLQSTIVMYSGVPSVLILGHSFVKRLKRDLRSHFDSRAGGNFNLGGTVSVSLHDIGE